MKKEIIEFSKHSIEKVNEIDDLIDQYIDDIKDIGETASDLFKPIKAFVSLYQTTRKIKFRRYLKSYAKGLAEAYSDKEKEGLSSRLKDYLSNENNLNYIYDTIDSAISSRSISCSGILGYFTSKVLAEQTDISYKELVLVNALRNINDIELEMTVRIFENTKDWTRNNNVHENDRLKPYVKLCEYTVQKLKGLQIFEEVKSKPGDGVSLGASFKGTYLISDISQDFFILIKDSGFYDEYKQKWPSA